MMRRLPLSAQTVKGNPVPRLDAQEVVQPCLKPDLEKKQQHHPDLGEERGFGVDLVQAMASFAPDRRRGFRTRLARE